MTKYVVYKLDKGGWALAVNPDTNCVIWHFDKKRQAINKLKELEAEVKV